MRDLETFKILDRYRYARANMIAARLGGSIQNRKRELGALYRAGILRKPRQQDDAYNARYSPWIYENGLQAEKALRERGHIPAKRQGDRQFWHQVMVSDIMLSVETWCRNTGRSFTHRPIEDLKLPCSISHSINGQVHRCDRGYVPDELFAIDGLHFALEADQHNEPVHRSNLTQTSYLRKLLQIKEVFAKKTYQTVWGIPSLFVLNITVSDEHCRNILQYMEQTLGGKSRSLLFKSYPILGSRRSYPNPLLSLLTDPWERVGHPPLTLGDEHWTRS
jgi:hypothetical protein